MISEADVISMLVPFPKINSTLAVIAHMYICLKDGYNKEFVKCQTFKPTHLIPNKKPYRYIIEDPNRSRNPFLRKTTIDCDKSFCVSNIIIDKRLLAQRNVCPQLFVNVMSKTQHCNFSHVNLDSDQLSNINNLIQCSQRGA